MDKYQKAQKALEDWWQEIPAPSFLEGLLTQPDRETVSMHDLRDLMEYLLDRTDKIPLSLMDLTPTPKIVLEPLRELMRLLTRVTIFVNPVQLITPDNVQKERALFFQALEEGKVYNPTFTYLHAVKELRTSLERVPGVYKKDMWDGLLQTLTNMHEHVSALASDMSHPVIKVLLPLVHAKINDDIAALSLAKALEAQDAPSIKKALEVMYTSPSDQDITNASSLAELLQKHDSLLPWQLHQVLPTDSPFIDLIREDSASAEDLEQATNDCLKEYYHYTSQIWPAPLPSKLHYRVHQDHNYTAYDVRDKSSSGPTIGIPPNPRSWLGILALCRHEIDMHVRQSLNGSLLYGFGGGLLKHNQEDLYEGTALFAERNFIGTLLGIKQAPALPYATLAYNAAMEGKSFHETFLMLQELFPARFDVVAKSKYAWNITYRVFRSRLSTQDDFAYGCAKDTGYLRGAIAAYYLHANGLEYLLDMGISPIEQLSTLRRLQRDLPLPYPDLNTANLILKKHFPHLSH